MWVIRKCTGTQRYTQLLLILGAIFVEGIAVCLHARALCYVTAGVPVSSVVLALPPPAPHFDEAIW
jgi:hypothetical protein